MGSQQERMPYLATPEALDNSAHSSSTSTQSRAKMNTPAPTPRTVPAICGERTHEPCTPLCLGLGAGQGVPLAPGSACFQHAPRVQEGGQTNTESPNSLGGISDDWFARSLGRSTFRGLTRNHTFRLKHFFLVRIKRLLSAPSGSLKSGI